MKLQKCSFWASSEALAEQHYLNKLGCEVGMTYQL